MRSLQTAPTFGAIYMPLPLTVAGAPSSSLFLPCDSTRRHTPHVHADAHTHCTVVPTRIAVDRSALRYPHSLADARRGLGRLATVRGRATLAHCTKEAYGINDWCPSDQRTETA